MDRKNKIIYNNKLYNSEEEIAANESPIEDILGKANVVSAEAGTKIKDGIDTKERCVVIGVEKKIDKKDLKKKDLISEKLFNGTITDIIEVPRIYSINCLAFPLPEDPKDKYRPLQGGVSSIIYYSSACTLGAIVLDNINNNLVALHNDHCLGLLYNPLYSIPTNGHLDVVGSPVIQPSPYDGGDQYLDSYGEVKRCFAIKFGGTVTNLVDCGLASIYNDEDASPDILSIGSGPFPFTDESEYYAGARVTKSGRTTCVTEGIISSTNFAGNVGYGGACGGANDTASFVNQIKISNVGDPFIQGGDSGSILLMNINGIYKIIGLCFAGSSSYGIANKIENVIDALNISEYISDSETGSIYIQLDYNGEVELGSSEGESINQSVYIDYGFSVSQISLHITDFIVDPRNDIRIQLEFRQALGSENKLDFDLPALCQSAWIEDVSLEIGENIFSMTNSSEVRPPGYYWITARINRVSSTGTFKIAAQKGGSNLSKFIKIHDGFGEYRNDISLKTNIGGYFDGNSKYFLNKIEFKDDNQYTSTTIKDED